MTEDYTSVKKMMTERMIGIRCADTHGGDRLCPECSATRDAFFAHLDACVHKDRGWPCMTCPDCCFDDDERKMMGEISAHMQEWIARHPEEAAGFAPPH